MVDWNHNGRRDIFDDLIEYELINGSDENNDDDEAMECSPEQKSYTSKAVYSDWPSSAKARRALKQVKNEHMNALIRETIRGYAEYNCVKKYEAFERLMEREKAMDTRYLWWFKMDSETERMLDELQRMCVKRLEQESNYHYGLCEGGSNKPGLDEFRTKQHKLAIEKEKTAEQIKRKVLAREAQVIMEERSKAEQEKERARQARLRQALKEKKKARRIAKINYFCSLKWIKPAMPIIIPVLLLIIILAIIISRIDGEGGINAKNNSEPIIAYFVSDTYLPGVWKEIEPEDEYAQYYYFAETGNIYSLASRYQDDTGICNNLTDKYHVSNSVKIEEYVQESNYIEGRFYCYPLGHTKVFTADYDEELGLVLEITDETSRPYDTGNGVFQKVELPDNVVIKENISQAAKEAGPFKPFCPVKDCTYQVGERGTYCSVHTCSVAGCTAPKYPEAQCCEYHCCSYEDCSSPISKNSDAYCDLHDETE